MARSLRGLSRGRQGSIPRRKTSWAVGPGQVGFQAQITASSSVIVASSLSIGEDGVTLARLRGQLLLYLSSATAGANGFTGAFGIGTGSLASVIAGAASVPGPITEQSWDGWLYWHVVHMVTASPLDGGAASDRDQLNGFTAVQRLEVDSKAMRKLEFEMSVFAVLEVVEIGTATLNWAFDSRALFMLP